MRGIRFLFFWGGVERRPGGDKEPDRETRERRWEWRWEWRWRQNKARRGGQDRPGRAIFKWEVGAVGMNRRAGPSGHRAGVGVRVRAGVRSGYPRRLYRDGEVPVCCLKYFPKNDCVEKFRW